MQILVIGGAGMLGRAITRSLVQSGHTVKSFDLQPSPGSLVGDIRDAAAVTSACVGMDAVIHTVAYVNQIPRKQPIMYDINVQGTRHVIAACQAARVPRLIYTSSIDVVFDGTPIANGDETLPYPARHLDYYSETKMLAEQEVIAANGSGGLATCSLRAAGIYGEHDRHRFPNVIPRIAQSGKYTVVGDGTSKCNHIYVDNMAHAFNLAVDRLNEASPLAGQSYFITDYAPSNFFEFFKPFLDALGIRYTESRLSAGLSMLLARGSERLYQLKGGSAPVISRYAVAATARDFWFNHDKAARDFDYAPVVSEADAFDRTHAWARDTLLS